MSRPSGFLKEASELPVIEGDDPPVIGWELDPGDVVCFHMQTLHTAAGNPRPTPAQGVIAALSRR